MFDLDCFLNELDKVYTGNPENLEALMKSGLKEAEYYQDAGSMLVILNELMGYYRVMSRYEDCEKTIARAGRIADEIGIQGTVNYAVMLLNMGTAWREMGKYEEAESCYDRVALILERELTEPDYRRATLYNNRSILYANTGRLREAKRDLERAMGLIRVLDESEIETAITHVNIGNICLRLQELEEGMEHMKEAVRIFEQKEGKKDSHYAAALSGMGEAYFRADRLAESASSYELALKEILSNYGENDYYKVTLRNLELVRSTIKRTEAVRKRKMKGMDISRAYYEEFGRSMLRERRIFVNISLQMRLWRRHIC